MLHAQLGAKTAHGLEIKSSVVQTHAWRDTEKVVISVCHAPQDARLVATNGRRMLLEWNAATATMDLFSSIRSAKHVRLVAPSVPQKEPVTLVAVLAPTSNTLHLPASAKLATLTATISAPRLVSVTALLQNARMAFIKSQQLAAVI